MEHKQTTTSRDTRWRWLVRAAALIALSLTLHACDPRGGDDPGQDLASITIQLREAPTDAGCAHIQIAGTQNITRTVDLSPGESTEFSFDSLPPGATTFSAQAFDASCATADTNNPSYVSDQVNRVLVVGPNPEVELIMRRAGDSNLGVALEFPGDERGEWFSPTGAPAGTPARVVIDAANSSASVTSVEVFVEGFFVQERVGDDGETYSQLSFPGLSLFEELGAPELPAVQMDLAVATDAQEVRFDGVEVIDSTTFEEEAFLVWPSIEADREFPDGPPERFVRNDEFYAFQGPWPSEDGRAMHPVRPKMGAVRGATVQALPVHWDPTSRVLEVYTHARFQFSHDGSEQDNVEITRERAFAAEARFENWRAVAQHFTPNLAFYTGDFLFIYPGGYDDELAPLVAQKKARGFHVTELTTAETGNTCASIRTAIANWYASRPEIHDKYALLVGDTDEIPQCTSPTSVPTDDLYATIDGDNLDEEIYLGRLSVDSEADADTQVQKILGYGGSAFFDYGRALLVAHRENAPGKYVGAHESVRTASYSSPPTFSTLYGHVGGATNGAVTSAVNGGMGVVAYRGHGSQSAWTGWNLGNEYYDDVDIAGLANPSALAPVVWSFACWNSNIETPDAMAEHFMETSNRGVSFYSATVPSYTIANHELDRAMFRGVFDVGLTVQAQAMEYGEDEMAAAHASLGTQNSWMYLLLGDPEMRILRGPRLNLVPVLPQEVAVCLPGGCELEVQVVDDFGNRVPDAIVSIYKAGGRFQDEVLVNRYTDGEGMALIPASPTSPGEMLVTVRDRLGNGGSEIVTVR